MEYGFKALRRLDGSSPVSVFEKKTVASTNDAMGLGDVLELDVAGTVSRGDASDVNSCGIVQYFEWTDDAGNFHQSNYLAASTASATVTVTAYYIPLEGIVFRVVADDDTSAVAAADVGANFNFIVAEPNSKTGLSGTMLDSNTIHTTATLPLQLIGLYSKPGNAYSNTAGTVEVEVIFITHSRSRFGSTGATT